MRTQRTVSKYCGFGFHVMSIIFGFGTSPEKIRHLTLSQSKSIYTRPTALMINEKPLANPILSELEGHSEVLCFKNFDLHIRELKLRKVKWLFQYHPVRPNNYLSYLTFISLEAQISRLLLDIKIKLLELPFCDIIGSFAYTPNSCWDFVTIILLVAASWLLLWAAAPGISPLPSVKAWANLSTLLQV